MATEGFYSPPSSGGAAPVDFWRTPQVTGGTLPDGATDPADAIARTGRVGIGPHFSGTAPVALLELAAAARTGTHGNTATTPLYVTGTLPAVAGCPAPATPAGGVEFRHSNGTQGVGIGHNGVYAAGSAANQELALMQKGAAAMRLQWQAKGSGWATLNHQAGGAFVVNGGFREEYFDNGCTFIGGRYMRVSSISPLDTYQQFNIVTNGGARNALELRASRNCAGTLLGAYMRVAPNEVHRKKIAMWESSVTDDSRFYGFGVLANTLVYQVPATSRWHRWYAGTGECTSQALFSVSGQAVAVVDPAGLSNGGNSAGALRFGAENSTTGIASGRIAGSVNQNGLNFFTGNSIRTSISAGGLFRHQRFSRVASDNRVWAATGAPALAQIDEDGSGGGWLSPILWLENNNCGAPCAQNQPPQLVITNSNNTSNLRGWISFIRSPGDQTILGDIRAVNNGTMQYTAAAALQILTAGVSRVTVKATGVVNIANLPNSAAGLVAGDLWRDANGFVRAA